MSGLKESVEINVQGAILGIQEGGFAFTNEFKMMPPWKQRIIIFIIVAIVPAYLIARVGVEQYLNQIYGRQALSAHGAFDMAQNPVVGKMSVIQNPNGTYSGAVLITNPNLDLAATGITYTAAFQNSGRQTVYNNSGTIYLLPNEKKYVVFPKIEVPSGGAVSSGAIELGEVKWQKKLDIPEAKLRATEPLLYDESNPLTFIVEGSIINESPYRISSARIVYLLFDSSDNLIGVSQRDEYSLVPFGRRAYKQLWPGLYRSQVSRVQVIPVTNTLDPKNITTDPSVKEAPPTNVNAF